MRRRTAALATSLVLLGCAGPLAPAPTARPGASRSVAPRAAMPTPDARRSAPASGTPASPGGSAEPLASASPAAPAPRPSASPAIPIHPLTRFQSVFGYSARLYQPGDLWKGPVHVNRGPVDPKAAWVNADSPGRSIFEVYGDSIGFRPVDGRAYPRFEGPVTLAYAPGVDAPPAPLDLDDPNAWIRIHHRREDDPATPLSAAALGEIFAHPANARGLGDRPGPLLVAAEVPLPPRLVDRLGPVLGLPPGADLAALAWFRDLPDGVFVPTEAMAAGRAAAYEPGAVPAGGIYVRGTVEVMRAAVRGARSYYLLQVGFPTSSRRRVYAIRADREARTLALVARPAGTRLAAELAAVGNDPARLFDLPAAEVSEPARWGLGGAEAIVARFGARAGAPFNGALAVDLAAEDPQRDPANRARLLPEDPDRRPLSGHILALGEPRLEGKTSLADPAAGLPADLAGAEVFSTEPAGDPAGATGLTILAAGSIFVQGHLLVDGLARAAAPASAAALVEALAEAGPAIRGVPDRLALLADRRVVIGRAAPSAPDLAATGLVLTASLVGLEDPVRTICLVDGRPYPSTERSYRGSLTIEGLFGHLEEGDLFEIGAGDALAVPRWDEFNAPWETFNPIYATDGGDQTAYEEAPRGRMAIFGTLAGARQGMFGTGTKSYDPQYLFDPRLADRPPPFLD